jgi:hypothetical protein
MYPSVNLTNRVISFSTTDRNPKTRDIRIMCSNIPTRRLRTTTGIIFVENFIKKYDGIILVKTILVKVSLSVF